MSQTASQNISLKPLDTPNGRLKRSDTHSQDLEAIYGPIQSQLASVEQILKAELTTESPWVDQLLQENWIGGGKRIRPVLLLLSAASCGEIRHSHLQAAAAVEMIHCATLVHDDVLDDADTRRHLPTVNATWDNRASVLLGDFLFTHAFYVASQSESPAALKILARAANKVCEGEIRQNAWQGNFDLSESDYLEMIADKTAELCSCSCRIGALLSDAADDLCHDFETYGRQLGVAFQIVDDVLDLVGHSNQVGKTLGTDLVNQKPTLPIIHCLKNSQLDAREHLIKVLSSGTARVEQILPVLEETGSIQYSRSVAHEQANSALKFAESLENSSYALSLAQLAHFVCQRTH